MHERTLTISVEARKAFAAAATALDAMAVPQSWINRVAIDRHDLTFWVLPSSALVDSAGPAGCQTTPKHGC